MHRMKLRFRNMVRNTIRRQRAAAGFSHDSRVAAFDTSVEEARNLFSATVEDIVQHCLSGQLVGSSAAKVLLQYHGHDQVINSIILQLIWLYISRFKV